MALRNLTNSPLSLPQQHRQTRFSLRADIPLGSDDSEGFTVFDISDDVYDAVKVTSDQNLPSLPASEFRSDNDTSTNIGQIIRRGPPQGTTVRAEKHATISPATKANTGKHRRSWSLNDLDCLVSAHETSRHRSTSSKEALGASGNTTAYPHLPPKPPPCRRSTPDGIPSFGTLEAQRLRLVNPSWLHRLGDLIFGRSPSTEESEHVVDSIPDLPTASQPSVSAVQQHQYQSPTEMLRRASGMTRPMYASDTLKKPRRSSLPKGVRKALLPGDLATAADGSHVRGRFGPRVSGHGVGQRTIDVHPLARRQGTSTLEEEVYAIDKACDRELHREQYQPRMGPSGSSLPQRSGRHDLDIRQLSEAEPDSSNTMHLLRNSDSQRQQNTGACRSIQPHPLPHSVRSSFLTHQFILSRTQTIRIPDASQADYDVDHVLSSESEAIHSRSMTEPAVYDVSNTQHAVSHDDSMFTSAIDDIVERPEHNQGAAEGGQSRDLKTEVEIC